MLGIQLFNQYKQGHMQQRVCDESQLASNAVQGVMRPSG